MSTTAAPLHNAARTTTAAPSWTLRIVVALVTVSFFGNAVVALMHWLSHS